MSESGKNRRDRAAAAREAANAGEKRREQIVRIVGAVTVVVVVVGIIVAAVVVKGSSSNDASSGSSQATADPNAALPATVLPTDDAYAYGVVYGTGTDAVPVLSIWEDFQCPACGSVEAANGAGIAQLAEEGKVKLIWRPTTFLDANLGNDASERAVAAWGCAIDADKSREYHDMIFANQPEVEGTGFSNEDLIGFASAVGIEGTDLDTFTTCYDDRKYLSWSANSSAIFYASGVGGTPSATLNGVDVPTEILADKEALDALVAEVSAAAPPAASPAPSAS